MTGDMVFTECERDEEAARELAPLVARETEGELLRVLARDWRLDGYEARAVVQRAREINEGTTR